MRKRILLLVAVVMAAVVSAYAQPRAIGGRIGFGFEASYQHSLSKNRMVNLDAGLPGFQGVEAVVTHDWIDPFNTQIPWDERGTWNWYLGVGGGLGWNWGGNWCNGDFSNSFTVGAAGRVGIEYNFWFPMQLSLDWRPMLGIYANSNNVGFYWPGLLSGSLALGVRYLF